MGYLKTEITVLLTICLDNSLDTIVWSANAIFP